MVPDKRKKPPCDSRPTKKKTTPLGDDCYKDILNAFELKHLTAVVSYEVWHSQFSDAERNILTQYLPRGADPDELVQDLLSGHNFHFGNPFLKWGASLCSGKLHPDDLLHREHYIKAKKKIHLSDVQKYHNDMIESLQRWKDSLDSSKDPQEETLHNLFKSRRQSKKRMDLCEMLHNNEDGDITSPESSSRATSDKTGCNNNYLPIPGDRHRRNVLSDNCVNETSDGLYVAVEPPTEEKLQKRGVQLGDDAKQMSYVKVSKEQRQCASRTTRRTSNSIQHRSLNTVLANIDTIKVQPCDVFEEEERQKLRDYWFRLVTEDFPAFYANWRERKLKAQELVKSICQDLEEKLQLQEKDDENDNLSPLNLTNDSGTSVSQSAGAQEDEEMEVCHTLTVDQMANQVGSREVALSPENEVEDYAHERQSLSAFNFREQVTGSDIIEKEVDPALMLPELAGHMNGVWSSVSGGGSFYHPATLGHQYGELAEMEAESSLLHGHAGHISNQPASFSLPKRMGLEYNEEAGGQFSCDFRNVVLPKRVNEEAVAPPVNVNLLEDWSWNSSGLDQTLFSVFSAPAPAPATSTSIPMPPYAYQYPYESMVDGTVRSEQQQSSNTLEWMGVSSHHNTGSGFLRSWNQYY